MKKTITILLAFVLLIALAACEDNTYPSSSSYTSNNTSSSNYGSHSASSNNNSSSSSSSSTSFTNAYGTPTTKCAHTGCTNYIASSGDTNCCTAHSNRCLECNKYIDEDATYCMSCIKKAAGKSSSSSNNSNSNSSSSTFTNAYGTPTTKCAHSGCNNYIASSGDTNCCVTHSKRCKNCNKYIDEDAMYCMSCIINALSD